MSFIGIRYQIMISETEVAEISRKKNESITFRIDSKVLDKLRTQSQQERLSLNTLVNQILDHYIEWDISSVKAGWVPMPKEALIELINHVDEKELGDLGCAYAKKAAKDTLLIMRHKYDLEEFISLLKTRARVSGFGLSITKENDQLTCIMQHGMRIKWSLFFKSIYQCMLNDLGNPVTFDVCENTLVLNIKNR